MNTNNAPEFATVTESPEVVNVAEFRNRISHLERIVNVDRCACRGADEIARWVETAQRIGGELTATVCRRATAEDWNRRERAINRSASFIIAATI